MSLKDKIFYVYGLGLGGKATLSYLQKIGAKVFAYDDNSTIGYDESIIKSPDQIDWSIVDYMVLSPGIQILKGFEHPAYSKAIAMGVEVVCDLDLFYMANPDATYFAITGTNGKSTTTALIGHILNSCAVKCYIGGNIGKPVLELPMESDAIYVFETSSFMLDLAKHIRFERSCITNLTPDHLDRHGNMQSYLDAKLNAFRLTTSDGRRFCSVDYEWTKSLPASFSSVSTISTKQLADYYCIDRTLCDGKYSFDLSNTVGLFGMHNMENILFAYAMTKDHVQNSGDIIEAIKTFGGLEHRMELVCEYNKLRFVNDSKATNADSAEKALQSFDDIIWIAGGIAKEGGISSLKSYRDKILKVYLIGQSAQDFANTLSEWGVEFEIAKELRVAIAKIFEQFKDQKATVLLSPACASMDQFKNFEERGKVFKQLVDENIKNAV